VVFEYCKFAKGTVPSQGISMATTTYVGSAVTPITRRTLVPFDFHLISSRVVY